jgi:hypothetical protein
MKRRKIDPAPPVPAEEIMSPRRVRMVKRYSHSTAVAHPFEDAVPAWEKAGWVVDSPNPGEGNAR